MIRTIRAIVWLRWRMMLNSLRGSGSNDLLERLSRYASVLGTILVALLVIPASIVLTGLLGYGGWLLATEPELNRVFVTGIRIGLMVATVMAILAPLARTLQAKSSHHPRLSLLPVRGGLLHGTEVVAGLADPWTAIFIGPLLALPAGLLAGGAPVAALIALLAGLSLLGVFVLIGSSTTFIASLFMRDRRRAEALMFVFFIVASTAGVIPLFIDRFAEGGRTAVLEAHGEAARGEIPQKYVSANRKPGRKPVGRELPAWTLIAPSEMYARTVVLSAEGSAGRALAPAACLATVAGLLWTGSAWSYRRLLETPAPGGRRAARGLAAREIRLPFVSPPVSAIAVTYFRSVTRTVQGRMAIYVSPLIVVAVGVLLLQTSADWTYRPFVDTHAGPLLVFTGATLSMMSVVQLMYNLFATDGPGLSLTFVSPVSDRDIALGKALGGLMLFGVPTILASGLALATTRSGSLPLWPAAALGVLSAYLVLAPLCIAMSALLPKQADLSKFGKAGRPHQGAVMIGMAAMGMAMSPPVGIAFVCAGWLGSPWLALAAMTVWTAAAGVASYLLTVFAARLLATRRENLLLVAKSA